MNVPELVLLRFTVFDSDLGTDDFLAQFSAPLTCLKQGKTCHCDHMRTRCSLTVFSKFQKLANLMFTFDLLTH